MIPHKNPNLCPQGGDSRNCDECVYGVDYKFNPATAECEVIVKCEHGHDQAKWKCSDCGDCIACVDEGYSYGCTACGEHFNTSDL